MNKKQLMLLLLVSMIFSASCGKSPEQEIYTESSTKTETTVSETSETFLQTTETKTSQETAPKTTDTQDNSPDDAEKYAEIVMNHEPDWLERYTSHTLNGTPMAWFEDLDFDGRPEFIVGGAIWADYPQGNVNYDFYRFTDSGEMVRLVPESGGDFSCLFAANLDCNPGLGYISGNVIRNKETEKYEYVYSSSFFSYPAEVFKKMIFGENNYSEQTLAGYWEVDFGEGLQTEYYGEQDERIFRSDLIDYLNSLSEKYTQCFSHVGTIPFSDQDKDIHPDESNVDVLSSVISDCYEELSDEERKQALIDSYRAYSLENTEEKPYMFSNMLNQLGVSEFESDELTEDDFRAAVSNKTTLSVQDLICDDFDGDGKKEAFVVLYDGFNENGNEIEAIYFVNSKGEATLMRESFYGALYDMELERETVDGKKYFAVSTNNGGSGAKAYLFGVSDGNAKEYLVDGEYSNFVAKNGKLYAMVRTHENGLTEEERELTYNSDKDDFEEIVSDENKPDLSTSWKYAYTRYIEDYVWRDDNIREAAKFYFLDIDGDDIPEIHIQSGYGYSGSLLLTYNKNTETVSDLQEGNSSYVRFIPGENVVDYGGGHMDVYYDHIYKIQNGEFVLIADGEFGGSGAGMQVDENGRPVYKYRWDDEELSEEDYNNKLNAVIPDSQAEYYSDMAAGYSYPDIVSEIENY